MFSLFALFHTGKTRLHTNYGSGLLFLPSDMISFSFQDYQEKDLDLDLDDEDPPKSPVQGPSHALEPSKSKKKVKAVSPTFLSSASAPKKTRSKLGWEEVDTFDSWADFETSDLFREIRYRIEHDEMLSFLSIYRFRMVICLYSN